MLQDNLLDLEMFLSCFSTKEVILQLVFLVNFYV